MSFLRQFNNAVGLPTKSGEAKTGGMSVEPNYASMMSSEKNRPKFSKPKHGPMTKHTGGKPMHLMSDSEFEASGGVVTDLSKKAEMEALRKAQGEFESSLDKMIKPSMEGGLEGALNTGALHVQSFFGDKMADHALQKMAAKKALEKGGEQVLKKGVEKSLEKGAGGIGAGAAVNMGLQAAGIDVGGMAKEAVGGGDMGGAVGGALSAGLSSGFNPVAMGVGAVMGIMSSAEERRAQKREAQAQALEAKAGGETNKARIKGRLAESMSKTLLSGMNRKVNL
jgi:hypothetical protein